uniref:Transmembrane protein n=1 Tax=Pithovirus LCPAC304 TaxID=2506594 RepID=A0A481Z878_9VIRU|nr:MAG: hypothetical protein LCPAC304_01540 [Pithovirus LCPAC304]
MSNKNCKAGSKLPGEIIGPILDGDEVIIAGEFPVEVGIGFTTLRFLTAEFFRTANAPTEGFSAFRWKSAVSAASSTKIIDSVPRFTIHYLANDPNPDTSNPLVFFTLNNNKAVNEGGDCQGRCVGVVSKTDPPDLVFPGIAATFYPPASTIPPVKSTQRYLAPGAPSPLQLIATGGVEGERSWFPLTLPAGQPPQDSKYVLALSNVAYTMNAVIAETQYKDVGVVKDFFQEQIFPGPPTLFKTVAIPVSDKQFYYIIPTKYFTSTQGPDTKGCEDCKANTDGGLGAFCSVGCTVSTITNNFGGNGICCEEECIMMGGLDCTQVCKFGFTQADDCKEECFYNYCTLKEASCSGDCKSSCPKNKIGVITEVCILGEMGYACQTGTGGPPLDQGLTTTEIAIIAIAAAFVTGLIIYAIYVFGTEYNTHIGT